MTEPFLNVIVAMDENNSIGYQNNLPWPLLAGDLRWYRTISSTTQDQSKRVAVILGRLSFEILMKINQEYLPRWHLIVITSQSSESIHAAYPESAAPIDVVPSFDEATNRVQTLLRTPSAQIESVFVFGGVCVYEQAMTSNLVKRVYLTRIFAKFPSDARWESLDLTNFQRIRRSSNEVLSEFDDRECEENGCKYQFQVYERVQ